MITLLENHPQKSELTLVLVPKLKEATNSYDSLPKPIAEVREILDKSGLKYDMTKMYILS